MHAITIKVCCKRRTYKRIDLDCMVIVDVYRKGLERMLVSTRWPVKKDYIPINYSPTDRLTNFECGMPFRSYSDGIGCLTISVGQT
uniref:Uncharacterized protein n=1 Tax=Arundo donax TaxID=35708 RepID=A0A0A9E5I6_ARUDO